MSDIVNELREEARDIPLLAKEWPQMVKSFTMIGEVFERAAAEIEATRAELAEAKGSIDWLFRCKEEWLVSTKPSMSNEGTTLTGAESEYDTIGPLRKYIYCVHGSEDNVYEGKTAVEAIKLYRAALSAMQEGK